MLSDSLGEVIFTLLHFIAPSLNLMPCLSSWLEMIACLHYRGMREAIMAIISRREYSELVYMVVNELLAILCSIVSVTNWGNCKLQFPYLLNMLCGLSLLFNIMEDVEEQFPEVRENSLYEKLWNHLDRRELGDFGSTKCNFYIFFMTSNILPNGREDRKLLKNFKFLSLKEILTTFFARLCAATVIIFLKTKHQIFT